MRGVLIALCRQIQLVAVLVGVVLDIRFAVYNRNESFRRAIQLIQGKSEVAGSFVPEGNIRAAVGQADFLGQVVRQGIAGPATVTVCPLR